MTEKQEHTVVFAGGLGKNPEMQRKLIEKSGELWKPYGFEPVSVYMVDWEDTETSTEDKMRDFENTVNWLSEKEHLLVDVMGLSAGAGLVFNAYVRSLESLKRLGITDKSARNINRVVMLCGRSKLGDPTYWSKKRRSYEEHSYKEKVPAYHDFVEMAEQGVVNLDERDKKQIMTARALFLDPHVPTPGHAAIEGAYNIELPSVGHALTIGLGLTVFRKRFARFLTLREK